MNTANAEMFIENGNIRDQYISKTEALDKVKTLVLLPDGEHLTVRMIAEFYEVDKSVIEKIIRKISGELQSDGVRVLKGDEAVRFNTENNSVLRIPSKMITIFTRRSVLRIGMLLRDSEIAKQIRNYLLDVEKQVPADQKELVFGEWTSEEIVKLSKAINRETDRGVNRMAAVRAAAKELNRKSQNVYHKLLSIESKHGSLEKYILKNNIAYINQESVEYHNEAKNTELHKDMNSMQESFFSKINSLESKFLQSNELQEKVKQYEIKLIETESRLNIEIEKNRKLTKALKLEKAKISSIQRILYSKHETKDEQPTRSYMVDRDGLVQRG